ncbi:MAG: PEPxxWA-CTERM sorting domain-containing protein [Sandarakinorhabdus sp.]
MPEPANWVMLIAGFGLAGATLRRHRRGRRSVLA